MSRLKPLLWVGTVLLALLWTGAVAVGAALLGWAGDLLASGGAADIGRTAAQWPVPPWLALWGVDPAMVRALQDIVLWSLNTLGAALPWAGSLMGWLVPLAWAGWAFGLVILLGLALAGHLLLGRRQRLAL